MFGLNPWTLLIAGIAFIAWSSAVGYKAYQFGGNAAQIVCERRVDALQAKYDEQAKRIAELNKNWQDAIDALVEQHSKEAELQQQEEAELQKKVDEYEKTIGDATSCITDQSDSDKLQ
jgi:hypothetical protein